MMKCPNSFICEICKKELHRAKTMEQLLMEHEKRKKTVPGYDDGGETVEICDPCFQRFVAAGLLPNG